jgi:uncharacterized protein YecE (DUF72 family)
VEASIGVTAAIRIGIAGWDYPDWVGPVYPVHGASRLDRLRYVAGFVDLVEINSTFYRPAAPRTAASWVRRTADLPELRFTAKAHRSWTHEDFEDAHAVVAPTLAGLAPLLEAGRLGAILIQFPQSFHFDPPALQRIEALCAHLAGWPVSIEVRHASWGLPEARDWFRERGLGWCAVDQPAIGSSTVGLLPAVTSRHGYLRLHGRNAASWFRADAGRDARYDYLYTGQELDALAATAREMAGSAEALFVVQNNHFRGQALVNALQLKARLTSTRPEAPADLVRHYPDLEREVSVRGAGLF